MKTIVITGSTRGIGYGLADAFLARGCRVLINGRKRESVDHALQSLDHKHGNDRLIGQHGDIGTPEGNQTLWSAAVASFGTVDIWINNAGIAHPYVSVWELPAATVRQVVEINLSGAIFGSQTAIRGMLQQGFGHVYNMEGFGSNGRIGPGISVYGATKSAVRFLSRSLARETQGTAVKVSTLSPGIVITELLTDQYEGDPEGLRRAKRIFNTLGDTVETVTPWLADRVLANDRSGAVIEWLTTPKLISRFATAPFRRRELFAEHHPS